MRTTTSPQAGASLGRCGGGYTGADVVAIVILAVLVGVLGSGLGVAAAHIRSSGSTQHGPLRMILRPGDKPSTNDVPVDSAGPRAAPAGAVTAPGHPARSVLNSTGCASRRAGCSRSRVSSLIVLAIDVAVFVFARDGTSTAAAEATREANAVAVIDPERRRVVANVAVGRAALGGRRRLRRRLGAEQRRGHGDAHRRALETRRRERSSPTRRRTT